MEAHCGRCIKVRFMQRLYYMKSRFSVVVIPTGYGLEDKGVGVGVPVEARIFFQTGSGAHPASYPMGTGGKAAGA
jgi:hypothetical protein